jgi:hypothetical protein
VFYFLRNTKAYFITLEMGIVYHPFGVLVNNIDNGLVSFHPFGILSAPNPEGMTLF